MRMQRPSSLALAVACAVALFTTGAAALDSGSVNINTASEKELEALPGVGEATAKKIVAGRPYSSVDGLSKAGLSQSTIGKLRSAVTVGGGAAAPAPATSSKAAKASAAPAAKAAGPVDLNTASLKDLEELPGVGEATAKKIIAGRPYSSVDDLSKAGVSKSAIDKLRSGATVSGTAAARPMPASTTSPAAGQKAAAPAAKSSGATVDLNTASLKDLEELPGVGEATAKKIVAGRPYGSVDDLSKAGLSKSTIDKLRSGASASGAAASPSAAAAPPRAPPASASAPAATPPPTAPAAPASAPPAAASAPAAAAQHASASAATTEPNKVVAGEKVNINSASLNDLERLPGIGPTKAQAIIDGRPYSTPADIMKVKGIKEGTYGKLKDNITVN
jgi:competence protein ComEA